MGSADAAFVTAAPRLVVFWVCASFFLTTRLFCDLHMTSHWQRLLSVPVPALVRYPGQEAFGGGGRICARAQGENYRSKESDWISMRLQCRVYSKMMFHQSTKGQHVLQVIHPQHLQGGSSSSSSSISAFELLARTKLQIMNLSSFYL